MANSNEWQRLQGTSRARERARDMARRQARTVKLAQRGGTDPARVQRDGNRPPALRASILAYGAGAVLGSYLLAPMLSAVAFLLAY